MAAPAITSDTYRGNRTRVVVIGQSGANDGNIDIELNKPLAAMGVQLVGTVAAGTVALQASNDNSNFVAVPTAVSFSAAGIKSVAIADLGYRYYRIAFASMNSSNSIVYTLVAKFY
jgi:hypothetical protein